MNRLIGKHKNKDNFCPICNSGLVRGRAEQVCEDGCEMWLECGKCGWSGNEMNRVETIWGWEDDYLGTALQAWQENIEELKQQENKA